MLGFLSGPILSAGRTEHVVRFLDRTDAAWLLMVDADMRFESAAVLTLLEAADPVTAPIVAGLALGEAGHDGPLAEAGMWSSEGLAPLSHWGADQLVPVDVVGAGCLLVHRGVFTTLLERHPWPLPWFAESTRDGQIVGEDWEFALRAREAGFPVHVHTGARIGHRKARVLLPSASYSTRPRRMADVERPVA